MSAAVLPALTLTGEVPSHSVCGSAVAVGAVVVGDDVVEARRQHAGRSRPSGQTTSVKAYSDASMPDLHLGQRLRRGALAMFDVHVGGLHLVRALSWRS